MEKKSQKDSARFMASLLSNFVNNLCERIHRINCKYGRNDEKCEFFRIKYIYCDCFLQKKNFKDDLIEYKRLHCNKTYEQKFYEKLKEGFFIYTNFLIATMINVFYYYKKAFILLNISMIGKNVMKQHYLKKKISIVT